jgi:hypothetical protein
MPQILSTNTFDQIKLVQSMGDVWGDVATAPLVPALPGPGVPLGPVAGYAPSTAPIPPPITPSVEEPLPQGPSADEPDTTTTQAHDTRMKTLQQKKYTNPQKMMPQPGF